MKQKKKIKLKASLQELQEKIDVLEGKWKRALADYQNLERRFSTEKEVLAKFLNGTLIEKLLVIVDDLERASEHIKDQGIKMILDKFKSVLFSEGVEEIRAENRNFDPETMDCVDLVKGPNNQVIKIIQKGYLLHGRVLRPVKVKVGKGGPPVSKAVGVK